SVLVPSNFVVQGVTSDEPEVMAVAERVNDMSRGDDDAQNNSVRKLRSAVWKHFEITRKVNGKPKAECRHCRKEFNCDTKMNGTSSMKKHLEKEHPETCTKKPPGAHPPNPSSTSELIVTGSSSMRRGKKRWSKAWEHFDDIDEENRGPIARCKYCLTEIKCGTKNGTSGMLAHNRKCKKKSALHNQPPNPSRTRDVIANVTPIVIGDPSSRKRMRGVEEPAQITSADTHTNWDKNELSSRIQNITSQLQNIRGEVGEVLKRHESDSPSSSHPSGGSPHPLKDNYDDLPYHLQQCFSYCSIFPNKYRFLGKDLVYIWISQGFVNCTNLSKRLEETGWEYLDYLVSR
uniref:BED-type domain-containing protein n=2 Tax=Aegilops tauschii TaxID=37682 RepID=A0A453CZW8_AEGTS